MDDSQGGPSADRLTGLVAAGDREAAVACLEGLTEAGPEQRKRAVRSLRDVAADDAAAFEGVATALVPFLTDDDRAVRLSTAKLFVAVAESAPDAVRPAVDALADRLGDEAEFYYVRARCAEALGYVALEHPDEVSTPAVLADFRVGLSFEEAEVREKLAKALEYVALGDPERLRHQVTNLAEHLDDERELVRYHLLTALVAVGCAEPARLADASEALAARLTDDSPHVRGRAAEALGTLAAAPAVDASLPPERLATLRDAEEEFVAERAAFALDAAGETDGSGAHPDVGTVRGLEATTEAAIDDITTPDDATECQHCGAQLPPDGPPTCPRCGTPR